MKCDRLGKCSPKKDCDGLFFNRFLRRLSNISAQGKGVSGQLSSSYAIKTKCMSGTADHSEKSRPIYIGFKEQVIL